MPRPTPDLEQAEAAYRKIADKVMTLSTEMEARVSAGKDAFTPEQWTEWEETNAAMDRAFSKVQELRRVPDDVRATAEKIFRRNNTSQRELDMPSSTFLTATSDRQSAAVRCWARSQSGMPVSEDDRQAAAELGVSPDSRDLVLDLLDSRDHAALRDGQLEQRILSGSGATSGQTLRPEGFVPMLEKAMIDNGPMLQVARFLQTDDGNDIVWPTADDTGNVGELLPNDNTAVGTADPTFSSVTYKAFPYSSKLVRVPVALIEDSGVDLASELGGMLGERLGKIANLHLTTGDDDAKPEGIVVGSTLGKTAAAVAAIADTELIDLQHSIDNAYRNDPSVSWMMSDAVFAYVRKLKDQDGRFLWSAGDGGLTVGEGGTLLGKPVIVNPNMPAATAGLKPILYGAMSKYIVRRVRQIRIRRLVERYAEFDQEGFIAFIRLDGRVLQPTAIKHLIMAAE